MRNDKVKRLSVGNARQASTLHVETPLGIVNIYCGLYDQRGREVVSVEVRPDQYAGECPVLVSGDVQTRLVRTQIKSSRPLRPTVAGMLRLFMGK